MPAEEEAEISAIQRATSDAFRRPAGRSYAELEVLEAEGKARIALIQGF